MAVVAETAPTASPRRTSLAANSAGLVAGKAVQMATGYAFWLVAARTAGVHEVGVAAAAVSAVMLCTQLGLLGSGSAAIVLLGRRSADGRSVVATALGVLATAAGVAAVVVGTIIALSAGDLGGELRDPRFATVILVASVFGTMIICFDQVSIAVGRGHDTFPRYLIGGALAVGALTLAATGGSGPVALVILGCWALDSVASCGLGWVQARRQFGGWIRPRLLTASTGDLLRLGLPNHALTLAERAPALLVPVLSAQVASARVTAAWYPAWMMAWVAYTAPVAVGLAQFSEIVRRPDQLRATTVSALRWSLLLGGGIAVVLAVGARPVLSLLGPEYAESSVGALRVLAVGLVPYAVIHAYHAVCRSTGRLREATVAAIVTGSTACLATAVLAPRRVEAMAVGWVLVFGLGGCWAALRLVRITAAQRSAPPWAALRCSP